MPTIRPPLFAAVLALAPLAAGAAQSAASAGAGAPFTIDADESLEYRQAEKLYVAKGRAKVTRTNPGAGPNGGASITADTLTAYERDKPGGEPNKDPAQPGGGNSEIWKFVAEGRVVIDNGNKGKPATAYGDHATYDIDSQRAVLTGRDLHLDSGTDKLTARDRFEYLTATREAIAVGDAKAVQQPTAQNSAIRTVTADTLHVYFAEADGVQGKGKSDPAGGLAADHMEAKGHVRVTSATPAASGQPAGGQPAQTSVATSDTATFDTKGNKAQLAGHVRIARGPNQLEGEQAEIDMDTGVSRLLASPANGAQSGTQPGRVRGLLMPGGAQGGGIKVAPAKDER